MINDILDFSKIEAGQLTIEKHPLLLDDLCTDVIELLSIRTKENNIGLILNKPASGLPAIFSDPVRLRQILINLIGNSIKFTKQGHVLINIIEQGRTHNHIALRFQIHDTGIGIPEEILPRLFKAFTQADSSTTRKYGGTGLGLVISKKLVEAMGGTIGAQSVAGKGSVFWFEISFPVCRDAMKGGNEHVSSLQKLVKEMPKFNAHILVAEDDRTSQRMIKGILNEIGCTLDIACDGLEALSRIEENPGLYDLVFMDCQMPNMDGFDATRTLRTKDWGKNLKIVSLTANAVQGDRERCLAAGADDYIVKPIRLKNIVTIFEKYQVSHLPDIAASGRRKTA